MPRKAPLVADAIIVLIPLLEQLLIKALQVTLSYAQIAIESLAIMP
jgi:hypothetical protein